MNSLAVFLTQDEQSYLERYLSVISDATVILFGSRLSKSTGSLSDIDILILVFDKLHTHTISHPEPWDIKVVTFSRIRRSLFHDRKRNDNWALQALCTGLILRDNSLSSGIAMQTEAATVWKCGPKEASTEELRTSFIQLRRKLAEARRLARRATESNENSTICFGLSYEIFVDAAYLFYRGRRRWADKFQALVKSTSEEDWWIRISWEKYILASNNLERVEAAECLVGELHRRLKHLI